jgi:hypothetical protein
LLLIDGFLLKIVKEAVSNSEAASLFLNLRLDFL